MSETPALYVVTRDCVNAETGATHALGDRLRLSPDSVLVAAGCAVPAVPADDAPAPAKAAPVKATKPAP